MMPLFVLSSFQSNFTIGKIAQKLLDVKISIPGKTMSLLLWNGLLGLLGGAAPLISWAGPIWSFFMDRLFSWAIEEGILALNLIGIEMEVNQQVRDYLKSYAAAELIDKNPNATKEMKNAAINDLFDKSVALWSYQRVQSNEGKNT